MRSATLALGAALLGAATAGAAGCSSEGGAPASSPSTEIDAGPVRDHDNPANDGEVVLPDAGALETVAYPFAVPVGFPKPLVPASNPLTEEKAELGRHLFYDARLSGNGTQSCGSCHLQELAFTDGKALAVGSTNGVHPRGSMSLVNVVYATSLTWPNPLMDTLERQANVPLFGIDPIVELGALGQEEVILGRLRAEPRYAPLFAAAYPGDADPVTMLNVTRAIASFERIIVSGDSPYDRWLYRGERDALTAQQVKGYELFNSERLECFHCHAGFNLTDSVTYAGKKPTLMFHNTGLYNIGGTGAYPLDNQGLRDFTDVPSDMGRFKAPTLRNVAKTAPYMHDGSITTLEGVLDHYAAGGRTIASGPNAGVGSASPYKSGLVVGFPLSTEDRAAVISFLESLTDDELLTNPKLADPWK